LIGVLLRATFPVLARTENDVALYRNASAAPSQGRRSASGGGSFSRNYGLLIEPLINLFDFVETHPADLAVRRPFALVSPRRKRGRLDADLHCGSSWERRFLGGGRAASRRLTRSISSATTDSSPARCWCSVFCSIRRWDIAWNHRLFTAMVPIYWSGLATPNVVAKNLWASLFWPTLRQSSGGWYGSMASRAVQSPSTRGPLAETSSQATVGGAVLSVGVRQ
jgi:hypothetical protein